MASTAGVGERETGGIDLLDEGRQVPLEGATIGEDWATQRHFCHLLNPSEVQPIRRSLIGVLHNVAWLPCHLCVFSATFYAELGRQYNNQVKVYICVLNFPNFKSVTSSNRKYSSYYSSGSGDQGDILTRKNSSAKHWNHHGTAGPQVRCQRRDPPQWPGWLGRGSLGYYAWRKQHRRV